MQKDFTIRVISKDGKQIDMQVRQKNQQITKRRVKSWTNEEDCQLMQTCERYPKKWAEIASRMQGRNQNQCLHRYRRLSKLGRTHKIWSSDEDESIRKLIKKYGKNWKLLSDMLGTKNGKQIRERFINKLDPKIKKQDWSQQEDMKILELYSQLGSKWSQISKEFTGRPENKIKNRFYSFIQKNYDISFKETENVDPAMKQIKQEMNVDYISFHKKTSISEQDIRQSLKILASMEENRRPQQRIYSKFLIPSINDIEFDFKNENMLSNNNLLESVLRVEDDWRAAINYHSIAELHSIDIFNKFQN